jgi:hypothetical protein
MLHFQLLLVLVLALATGVLGIETTSILSELKNLPACGVGCLFESLCTERKLANMLIIVEPR